MGSEITLLVQSRSCTENKRCRETYSLRHCNQQRPSACSCPPLCPAPCAAQRTSESPTDCPGHRYAPAILCIGGDFLMCWTEIRSVSLSPPNSPAPAVDKRVENTDQQHGTPPRHRAWAETDTETDTGKESPSLTLQTIRSHGGLRVVIAGGGVGAAQPDFVFRVPEVVLIWTSLTGPVSERGNCFRRRVQTYQRSLRQPCFMGGSLAGVGQKVQGSESEEENKQETRNVI